jgi:hypothetical protein
VDISQAAAVTGALPIGNGGSGQTSANAALNAFLPSQTGNNTKFLQTDGTNTSWQSGSVATATPTVAGVVTSYFPTIQSAIKTVSSADYTITTTDGYELVYVTTGASARTITLPAASANTGRLITIKKSDSGAGAANVTRAGADTIEGLTSVSLTRQYDWLTLFCDGTTWIRAGHGIVNPGTTDGLVAAAGVPANTTGSLIATGYVGEMFGSVRTGSGGNAYSARTTTAGVSSGNSVVSITLNKGLYWAQFNCSHSFTATNTDTYMFLYIGSLGFQVGITQRQQGPATSGNYLCFSQGMPILITADSTSVGVGYGSSNNSTSASNDLCIVRLA